MERLPGSRQPGVCRMQRGLLLGTRSEPMPGVQPPAFRHRGSLSALRAPCGPPRPTRPQKALASLDAIPPAALHWPIAYTGFLTRSPWATDWLERIGEVFHLARLRRRAWQPELPLEHQAEDFEAAQASLKASLGKLFDDALQEWRSLVARYELLIAVPSGGRTGAERAQVEAQGKATASLIVHEAGLSVFLEDPAIPMDNNYSERTLRGPVISRRLSFGSGGPAGAETAGRLLSVLQTAKQAGLNAYRYMLDWLDACARNRGQAPSDLSPWLPWEMDEQRIEELRAHPIRWWTPANGPPATAPADAPDSTFLHAA